MEPLTKRLWSHLCRVAGSMPEVPLLEFQHLCAACASPGEIPNGEIVTHAIGELLNLGIVSPMDADEKASLRNGKRASGSYVIILNSAAQTMYFKIKSPEVLRRQLVIERDSFLENVDSMRNAPTMAQRLGANLRLSQSQMAQIAAGRSPNLNWNDLVDLSEVGLTLKWYRARGRSREDEMRFLDYLSHVHQNELENREKQILLHQDRARTRITEINILLSDPIFKEASDQSEPLIERMAIPLDVQREVWRRDQGRCVYCASQENLEFDHIIPVTKGGSSTVRNIQLLCQPCNRKKSAEI